MKKFLVLMSLVFSVSTFAQNKEVEIKLPMKCYPKEVVMKALSEQYKEELIFAGIDEMHEIENLSAFIAWNSKTETYTVGLYSANEGMICIVSGGLGNFVKKQ